MAPLEFTMPRERFEALGGYTEAIQPIESITAERQTRLLTSHPDAGWPTDR